MKVERPDHVWSTAMTDVRLSQGFVYWVAIMDWDSRYVLAGEVSVTFDSSVCVSALECALIRAQLAIFNSDQGAQFTRLAFTKPLLAHGVLLSMDGRGRVFDNMFVERLWRSVTYEEVYRKDDRRGPEAMHGLQGYFEFYHRERIHQSLTYPTPAAVYRQGPKRAAVTTFNGRVIGLDSGEYFRLPEPPISMPKNSIAHWIIGSTI